MDSIVPAICVLKLLLLSCLVTWLVSGAEIYYEKKILLTGDSVREKSTADWLTDKSAEAIRDFDEDPEEVIMMT